MSVDLIGERNNSARRIVPLLISTGISVTGDGAFLAGAPLLAAVTTSNPLAVSAVTAGFYLPWIVAGLPSGALVDRLPRRSVMIIADVARACVLASLVALMFLGLVSAPIIVTAVLCAGVAQCFFDAAAQSIIPMIVGRDKGTLAEVNGRFWSLDTVGRGLLGPPLGSLLFSLGRVMPFVADAASFLASAALVRRLPYVPAGNGPRESLRKAICQGVRHVRRTPDMALLAVSAGAANFAFNASMAIFVLYAREVLGIPAAAYGLLSASGAVGGVLAGWRASELTRRMSYRQTMAFSCLAQAAAWAGTAITENAWVAATLFTAAGAATSLANVALASARQELTPGSLLGRVTSTYRAVAVGSSGLGAITGGVVAARFGLAPVLFSSSSCLLVNGILTWPRKRLPAAAAAQAGGPGTGRHDRVLSRPDRLQRPAAGHAAVASEHQHASEQRYDADDRD
jgi:MFS family permease